MIKIDYSIEDLENILDSMPQQIVYRDLSGKHIYCNDAYANELLGMSKEKIYGKRYDDFKSLGNKLNYIKERDKEVLRKMSSIQYEDTIYNNEGKEIVEITKIPTLSKEKKFRGY